MAAAKKQETKSSTIYIQPMEEATAKITIVGDTPLIVSKWTKKAKQELLDSQTDAKKTKKQKTPKNIWGEFADSLYWMDGGPDVDYSDWTAELFEEKAKGARFGFPCTGIKAAALMSAVRGGYVRYKTEIMGDFWIVGEGERQLVEIHSPGLPSMREDNVRLAGIGRNADLRYRPQFLEWSMDLLIRYDLNGNIDLSSILNLINLGGHKCGIGEWRTEKSGTFGQFHVKAG